MQCCETCLFRRKPDDFYETCTVLASKWNVLKPKNIARPFWLSKRLHRLPAHIPDMTARTLANEGKNCGAYIPNSIVLGADGARDEHVKK